MRTLIILLTGGAGFWLILTAIVCEDPRSFWEHNFVNMIEMFLEIGFWTRYFLTYCLNTLFLYATDWFMDWPTWYDGFLEYPDEGKEPMFDSRLHEELVKKYCHEYREEKQSRQRLTERGAA